MAMQTLYCGRCGAPLLPGAVFCGRCGAPQLAAASVPAVAMAVAAPPMAVPAIATALAAPPIAPPAAYGYRVAQPGAFPGAGRAKVPQAMVIGGVLLILVVAVVAITSFALARSIGTHPTCTSNCGPQVIAPLSEAATYHSNAFGFEVDYNSSWKVAQSGCERHCARHGVWHRHGGGFRGGTIARPIDQQHCRGSSVSEMAERDPSGRFERCPHWNPGWAGRGLLGKPDRIGYDIDAGSVRSDRRHPWHHQCRHLCRRSGSP